MLGMFNRKKKQNIKAYNKLRDFSRHSSFCFAPLTSLRFHRNGGVQVCCHHIDFEYLKDKTIKEIWFGEHFNSLREKMGKYEIPSSCGFCSAPFYSEDYINVNALDFDFLEPNENGYPVLMDFSLENTCNLSCIMCDASLSSSIQNKSSSCKCSANGYQYDDDFLKQIAEFIPFLKLAVFTGGEPFLIKSYYKIWELMFELNPDIQINVTTNGTIYNEKIDSLLRTGRFNITISLDSLVPNVYNNIRQGANFEKTYANVMKYADICNEMGTTFTITVCPMQINMYDIPDIVKVCNSNQWELSFNTVLKPWPQALWSLDINVLEGLISAYKEISFDIQQTLITKKNQEKFNALISLLENWATKLKRLASLNQDFEIVNRIKNQIEQTLSKALNNSDSENRVFNVVDSIPIMLINSQLLDYTKNLSAEIVRSEFDNYDNDTIVDHLCIVAFNL